MFDLAIIGGGPAGVAAAIVASAAGLRTAMLTADDELSKTPVEESVHPGCLALLRRLGIDTPPLAGEFPGIVVSGELRLFGSDDKGPWLGAHLNRAAFDAHLLDRAFQAGVQKIAANARAIDRDGSGFRLSSEGGRTVEASRIIDATGRTGFLRRAFGLRARRLSPPLLAWRGRAPSNEATGSPARFNVMDDGWQWTAPIDGHTLAWTEVRPASKSSGRQIDAGRSRAKAATWMVVRPVSGPGWALAGDAAGSLDPAAGSGIFFALTSGICAAQATIASLAAPRTAALHEAAYDDWALQEIEGRARTLKDLYQELQIIFDLTEGAKK